MAARTCRIRLLHEAEEFLDSVPLKAYDKITRDLQKVAAGVIAPTLFKKLKGTEVWELRTIHAGMAYRLFAFWDTREEALVVATHGITKKTDKTPRKEIEKAEQIRVEYFNA